jgi:hypothetical protein
MAYEFEAFFSYKRSPQSDEWHQKVKEVLQFWLRQELEDEHANIFIDTEDIQTGARWRTRLGETLLRSKCIVCIWSPLYFRSQWCQSEWRTFMERESKFGTSLIVPASYHDGESFPRLAKDRQKDDFSIYASQFKSFWDSYDAVLFERKIRLFAKELAKTVRQAPPFDPGFPLIEAEAAVIPPEPPITRPSDV